jgi:hypothetical protein
MTSGALFLLPALLLLIAGPVASLLARGEGAQRSLLAAGDAFVSWWTAIALWAGGASDRVVAIAVGVFGLVGLVALRDVIRAIRPTGETEDGAPVAPSLWSDARLAVCILALLAPSMVFVDQPGERASLLVPFGFIAVSTFGSRFAHDERGLRLTGAVLFAMAAAHLVVALRWVLSSLGPEPWGWTLAGTVTFGVACAVLLAAVGRAFAVALGGRPVAA